MYFAPTSYRRFLFLRRTGRICSVSVWNKKFLFAIDIFRTPAKKFRQGKNVGYMLALIWKTRCGEAATGGVLRKGFLKVSQNSQKNTRVGVSFSIQLQVSGYNFIKKENPTQVFFGEFCGKIFKNVIFYRVHPGDCFSICLLFFGFRFVLLLHYSVKLGVIVMLDCRVNKNC